MKQPKAHKMASVGKRGDVVLVNKPFVYTVLSQHADKVCHYCLYSPLENDTALMRCGKCRFTRYCSAECQAKDWKENFHSIECAGFCRLVEKLQAYTTQRGGHEDQMQSEHGPNGQGQFPDSDVRLLYRVLISLKKGRDTENAGDCMPDLQRNFWSLCHHRDEMLRNVEHRKRMQECIERAMLMLSAKDLTLINEKYGNLYDEIYSRIFTNTLTIYNKTLHDIGMCLGFGMSAIDHSCFANATFLLSDITRGVKPSIEIVLLRDLPANVIANAAGDPAELMKHVTISYVPLMMPRQIRQRFLKDEYFFTCTCRHCDTGSTSSNLQAPDNSKSSILSLTGAELDAQLLSIKCPRCINNDGIIEITDELKLFRACNVCENVELPAETTRKLKKFLLAKNSSDLVDPENLNFKIRINRKDETAADSPMEAQVFEPEFWEKCALLSPLNSYYIYIQKLASEFFLACEDYGNALHFHLNQMLAHEHYYAEHPLLVDFCNQAAEQCNQLARYPDALIFWTKAYAICLTFRSKQSDMARYLEKCIETCKQNIDNKQQQAMKE